MEQEFKQKTKNNEEANSFIPQFKKVVGDKIKKFREEVSKKNTAEAESFVKKQFESIDRRVKQSEFKGMGELIK